MRIDDGSRYRFSQRRAAITIGLLCLVLFGAFWYAYSYYRAASSTKSTPNAKATCRPLAATDIAPENTTIHVYNATKRQGLAASVAQTLRLSGFNVSQVANDPLAKKITAPAEVRFGPKGAAKAKLLAARIGKGVVSVADKRANDSVDVVLGDGFVKLLPAPSATGLPFCPKASPAATNKTPAATGKASPSAS